MGFLDFHYQGGDDNPDGTYPGNWKNYQNNMHGSYSTTKGHLNSINNVGNPIKMTVGTSIKNSTLSNPLTVAGTHCRAWITETGDSDNDPYNDYSWLGVGVVATGSLSGDLTDGHYPINDTPANGHLIAHSLRAFVRIDGVSGQGACVGLVARHPYSQWDYRFSDENDFTGPDDGRTGKFTTHAAYVCQLTTCTIWNYQGTASNVGTSANQYPLTAPQLIFYADRNDRHHNTNTDYQHVVNCGGTFAFDTWYHIRMDVEPAVSGDTIKIYTAPATEAIGSETWTLLQTINIASSDNYYIPPYSTSWPTNNSRGAGYIVGQVFREDATVYDHQKIYLDGFQFLTQDLSS